jgi:hypothetical protein
MVDNLLYRRCRMGVLTGKARSFRVDTSTHVELGLMQGFPPPPDKRVTRSNGVKVPPFNRWAYPNMRQIWPTDGSGRARWRWMCPGPSTRASKPSR